MIDTHCHLYAEEFDGDRAEAVTRAREAGVTHILLPNIDVESIQPMYDLCDQIPDMCFPMMGLHPTYIKEDYKQQLSTIEKAFADRTFCGVGEIGLDYYWDTTFAKEQQEAFRLQMEWSAELNLPVAIHTRNSFEDALRIVQEVLAKKPIRGVFHCFSGTADEAKQVLELGSFYMGIGGVSTFKKAGLDLSLIDVPMDKLLLETDAPYLAPVPFRGKRNEPAYLQHTAARLAEIKGVSVNSVKEATTANAKKLFLISA